MHQVSFKIFSHFAPLKDLLQVLATTKYDNYKTSYRIKRLIDELSQRHKDFTSLYDDIMKGAKWDKVADIKDINRPRVPLNKKDLDTEIEALFETTFELQWAPLTKDVLEEIKTTPEQINVLEYLVNPKELEVLP